MTKQLSDETLREITGGDEALAAVLADTLDRSRHATAIPTPPGLTPAAPARGDGLHFFSPLCGDPRDRLSHAGRRREP